MSRLFSAAKTKLYVGAAAMSFDSADLDAEDFTGVTWTEVKGLTNLGTLGDNAALITSDHMDSGRTRKLKGVRNAGSMAVTTDLNYGDAGQAAMAAAEKTALSYPFRVVFNDAPPGGTPSERLFVAFVMSASEGYGEANSPLTLNVTLEVDSNVVRIDAAEAEE